MPQINPDEAATDEPKTYKDEAIGDGDDLNDIKGDLCGENDGEQIRQPYHNKTASHRSGDEHRRKDDIDREHPSEMGPASRNYSYPQQELGSIVPGLNPLFSNGFLQSSSQVPYSPYMSPYSIFCSGSSPMDLEGKPVPNRPSQSDVPPMYPLPGQLGQIPNPLAPWSPGPLYPLCTAGAVAGMLRYPYPFANFSSSGAMGSVPPFPLVPPHPHGGGIHPNMLHPGNLSFANHMNGQNGVSKPAADKKHAGGDGCTMKRSKNSEKSNRPYVKKPLNAFMLYMKEQRAQVVAECTLKESAAINQILGRKWHSLKREEQQKYYEMARKERQLHMQMFPGWSARDNYGKRKKRKKEKTQDCTASSFYVNAPFQPYSYLSSSASLRRKKKCIRYQHDGDDSDDSDASGQGQDQLDVSNFSQPLGNQSFDPSDSINQPSLNVTNSNSITSNQSEAHIPDRGSPCQPTLNDRVKQEKSSPLPPESNGSTHTSSNDGFHPSPFSSTPSEATGGSSVAGVEKRVSTSTELNSSAPAASKHRSYTGEHYTAPSANGFVSGGNKHTSSGKDSKSNSDSPHNSGGNNAPSTRQNVFNSPMMSSINIGSPPNNSHPFLPNFPYFTAGGLPPSPLGGLMGFNFKGIPSPISPMNMGLKPPGASVATAGHPGSSAPRHASSALEGKS